MGVDMSGHAVRQQFMKEFRGLRGNTRRISGMIVVCYVLQVVAATGLGYWFLQQPLTLPTGLGVAVVMFFIGTRLRGFNNIVHECCHFTFTLNIKLHYYKLINLEIKSYLFKI